MGSRKWSLAISVVVLLSVGFSPGMNAQQTKKSFTVADDIGFAFFADRQQVQFSPDGNYLAVYAERGRLDLNCVEDSLRFYRTQDVQDFLDHPDRSQAPAPGWILDRSDKVGPVINDWRWLADSSGVAFLNGGGLLAAKRLVLADLRNKKVEALTAPTETVKIFDVRDRDHFVYIISDRVDLEKLQAERKTSAVVGTGHFFYELVLPDDPVTVEKYPSHSYLWAVVGGKRFEVKHDGTPLDASGYWHLALSPDGQTLVTRAPVPEVPTSWETLYPPPFAPSPDGIHAGHNTASQFIRVDLQTGSVQALTQAPVADSAGWDTYFQPPSWSSDGQEILLPGTFIKSKDHQPSRPCIAVVDLSSNTCNCVEMLQGRTGTGVEKGFPVVFDGRFVDGDNRQIAVSHYSHNMPAGTTEYQRMNDGAWQAVGQINGEEPQVGYGGLEVTMKQWLNEPPLLVAANKQVSRVIWDPNPQLKTIELGQASVYKWKDTEGREWRGGLFKPTDYKPGRRYPLVIQTHGFVESLFLPFGSFTTGFAARELAAAGIVVLQVEFRAGCPDTDEGPCVVRGYEAGANQLVSEGLVDPERIGIIGFSRTCFDVMEELTTGSLHLKAALITDGVMASYFEYMMFNEAGVDIIGAKPFGEGMQQWLRRSPSFNLDKVTAPLLVFAGGPFGVLGMWEPYAGLRYLHKPADFIMLNMDNGDGTLPYEHTLTNPGFRMVSQGGSVDWFRFWLQGYEDPDPAKHDQYVRWRGLRALQEKNDAEARAQKN